MTLYNPMSCEGFAKGFFGGCSMVWLTFAMILFLALILRRQCRDGILSGTNYNDIGGFGGGLGLNLLATIFFGDPRWSLVAGIVGVGVGGFLLGVFMPSESE